MPYPYKSFRDWFEEEEKRGNALRVRVPIQCGDYESIVPIGNGIPGFQPKTEMRALSRYLHSQAGKPTALIEHPVYNRPDVPVVVNPWPTRERVLRAMGFEAKEQLCRAILDIPGKRIPPLKVAKQDAPCKQVVIPGNRVDLRRDMPRVWVEFHQCLWSGFNGTAVVHDPTTGSHSLGKIRVGQYEWQDADPSRPVAEERLKRFMFAAVARGGVRPTNTGQYYLKYRAEGRPLPAAFTFGDPADMDVVAALKTMPWPASGDEYAALGGLRGEPLEIVEAETIPGLFVPARSQWVFEGEFVHDDERLPEYAGDDNFIPYIVGSGIYTVFRVTCITHCRNPWWAASLSSSSGLHGQTGTHTALAALNLETEAINFLRGRGYRVKDVALHAGPLVAVIQLAVDAAGKPHPHYGREVGLALANYGVHVTAPYIIVVGPDCNPEDGGDVLWTLGMLTRPGSDATVVRKEIPGIDGLLGVPFPGQQPQCSCEQIIIDATIPVPERYAGWRPRSDPPAWEQEAIRRLRQRLEGKS